MSRIINSDELYENSTISMRMQNYNHSSDSLIITSYPKFEFIEIEATPQISPYNDSMRMARKFQLFKIDQHKYQYKSGSETKKLSKTPIDIFSHNHQLAFYHYGEKSIVIIPQYPFGGHLREYGNIIVFEIDKDNQVKEICRKEGDGTNTILDMFIPRTMDAWIDFQHAKEKVSGFDKYFDQDYAEQYRKVLECILEQDMEKFEKLETSIELSKAKDERYKEFYYIAAPARYLITSQYPVGYGGGDSLVVYDISQLHNGEIHKIETGFQSLGDFAIPLKECCYLSRDDTLCFLEEREIRLDKPDMHDRKIKINRVEFLVYQETAVNGDEGYLVIAVYDGGRRERYPEFGKPNFKSIEEAKEMIHKIKDSLCSIRQLVYTEKDEIED